MRAIYRAALLTLLFTTVGAGAAHAVPINVAEFRWDLLLEPGIACPPDEPSCVPEDPLARSIFTLTNIWDGPAPGATLFDNQLVLSTGSLAFFDLEPDFPLNFDQLSEIGVPTFASTGVSFLFGAEVVSLGATLTQPDTFAVLQFNPTSVAEPGTLGLLALGVTMLARRRPRSAGRRPRS